MKKVLVLPGDGVGAEVCHAALPVFTLLNLPITLEFAQIGWQCWQQSAQPIPAQTWEKITQSDAVLLGAITSKGKQDAEAELTPALQGQGHKYVSPLIEMRQKLELFANVRPVYSIKPGQRPFRCVVLRENTEGLYCGLDRRGIPEEYRSWVTHTNIDRSGHQDVAMSVRIVTRFGMARIIRYAFEYAKTNNYPSVTYADKPNVLRESGQFASDIFWEIAAEYPDIHAEIHNADAVALWLVQRPERFGVIVAENMYGDILSDLAAGVMGGLGIAPSANIGAETPYFEPVHGSAPRMANRGKANPAAMFLTIGLMLEHLGFGNEAEKVKRAVTWVIQSGDTLTYDLGGNATTQQMADKILEYIQNAEGNEQGNVLAGLVEDLAEA
ncbi:isocitrate/isopropylmalate dehydrogenase family protein [Rouxiella badensis]|jgi:isocitrate dehydrogenase|uniref:3-isopropylmalate dehydrogenase n=1 Tax=Rouxiella badensis TaxID=1646377 RepID=A0A1X0WG95_9GAMM|nr:isocitrate/isopropylmalate dehydrogenase family protein [Rouxiella badensis]MCC3704788.1 isocitrate/isopropylmalate dehydrogenase family protein [Rouxiella badensis]MCC3720984.1 isocitrate/isopropylmalate dehydrogenase family protein [Rouxiella badensis]MCC3729567.1 isocitrate/isopropylmalate dehydrogenase family protein [Rouxiella badensis]MCC3735406.1 isocitrate/isopropylmalate dehydrogenase family protein [Rouxiella badensis]MCC3741235.1 isocitrate/isopropylmalate dehydrogenase family pr